MGGEDQMDYQAPDSNSQNSKLKNGARGGKSA